MCVNDIKKQVENYLNEEFSKMFGTLLPGMWNKEWPIVAEKALQLLKDNLHQDPLDIPANIITTKKQILTAYNLANTLTLENIDAVYHQLMKSSNRDVVKYLSFFLNESNREYLVIWKQTPKSSYSKLQVELSNSLKKGKITDHAKKCLRLLGCCCFFNRTRAPAQQEEANFFPKKCYIPEGDVKNSNHRLSTFLSCCEISSPQYWARSGYYYTGYRRTIKCAGCKFKDTDPPVTESKAVHLEDCVYGGEKN